MKTRMKIKMRRRRMFRIRMIVILKVKVNVNVKFSSLVFCQSCCVVINTDHILCVGTCNVAIIPL